MLRILQLIIQENAAWKIQLKQNNVELEKGQWYRLSLDAQGKHTEKIDVCDSERRLR